MVRWSSDFRTSLPRIPVGAAVRLTCDLLGIKSMVTHERFGSALCGFSSGHETSAELPPVPIRRETGESFILNDTNIYNIMCRILTSLTLHLQRQNRAPSREPRPKDYREMTFRPPSVYKTNTEPPYLNSHTFPELLYRHADAGHARPRKLEAEVEVMWGMAGMQKDVMVDIAETLCVLTGDMNERRKAVFLKVYIKLDPNKSGSVSQTDIEKFYCVNQQQQTEQDATVESDSDSDYPGSTGRTFI
ncbi:calcyphosin-2 [Silurus meridionalis]|nr:calcyphosin-2 [Silurus meridionalis]